MSFSVYDTDRERFAVSTLGKFLVTREEGRNAFAVLSPRVALLQSEHDRLFFDCNGVIALSPSYCDELFGQLEVSFPGAIILDQQMSHALRVAFETVEETRNVKFTFGVFR
jgi:hypothetical protein